MYNVTSQAWNSPPLKSPAAFLWPPAVPNFPGSMMQPSYLSVSTFSEELHYQNTGGKKSTTLLFQ